MFLRTLEICLVLFFSFHSSSSHQIQTSVYEDARFESYFNQYGNFYIFYDQELIVPANNYFATSTVSCRMIGNVTGQGFVSTGRMANGTIDCRITSQTPIQFGSKIGIDTFVSSTSFDPASFSTGSSSSSTEVITSATQATTNILTTNTETSNLSSENSSTISLTSTTFIVTFPYVDNATSEITTINSTLLNDPSAAESATSTSTELDASTLTNDSVRSTDSTTFTNESSSATANPIANATTDSTENTNTDAVNITSPTTQISTSKSMTTTTTITTHSGPTATTTLPSTCPISPTVGPFAAVSAKLDCPSPYIFLDEFGCYFPGNGLLTWSNARSSCLAMGGDLVTFENLSLAQILYIGDCMWYYYNFHVGFTGNKTANQWVTGNMIPSSNILWYPGNPVSNVLQTCGRTHDISTYKIQNVACTAILNFVCEIKIYSLV